MMIGFSRAQHTRNAYHSQIDLPRRVSSTRVITSAKHTNSRLTCDNKIWRQCVGQTFVVRFLGKFEHSDVIGTNPYLALHRAFNNRSASPLPLSTKTCDGTLQMEHPHRPCEAMKWRSKEMKLVILGRGGSQACPSPKIGDRIVEVEREKKACIIGSFQDCQKQCTNKDMYDRALDNETQTRLTRK